MADQYDVVVLGAGPGGYVAAIRAAQLGLSTAIVEKKWWGGVCLNVGCIPSKALLHNAGLAHTLQHDAAKLGFSFDNLQLDYGTAFKRSRKVSDRLVKGVGFLMKKNKIDQINGWGTLQGTNSLKVDLEEGGEQTVGFKNLIIGTGAQPRMLPGTEADGEVVISYLEAILSDTVPEKAVVVGGGAIGLEIGYVWKNYGSDVTIVELMDHLAPLEDPEVSAELEKQFKRTQKIEFMTGSSVEKVDVANGKATVTIKTADGEKVIDGVDKVLVAIGWKPNVEGYGLESTGVNLTDRGAIDIDTSMRTNVPNIYAIGDVTSKLMLAHVASAQGIIAAETIANHPTIELNYTMMPRAYYMNPQIASFGYTEAQAQEAGYEVETAKFPFSASGKAQGMNEGVGFVKLISDARYGEILGGHMIGPEVTELLPELTLAQYAELTAEEIARNVHAHPTLSETLMESAHGLMGHMIHL